MYGFASGLYDRDALGNSHGSLFLCLYGIGRYFTGDASSSLLAAFYHVGGHAFLYRTCNFPLSVYSAPILRIGTFFFFALLLGGVHLQIFPFDPDWHRVAQSMGADAERLTP